jgi:hypothetical protein
MTVPRAHFAAIVPTLLLVGACSSTNPSPSAITAPEPTAVPTTSIASAPASVVPPPSGAAASAAPASAPVTSAGASETASIDPANFVAGVDNPWFPLKPGSVLTYRGIKDGQVAIDKVTVPGDTITVAGVPCIVVHDDLTLDGQLAEQTDDWYAQDKDGNVWYFGEDTKELEGGKVTSTEGSWTTGVDGAQAGIFMPADPQVGTSGLQEFLAGHAEDRFVVLLTDSKVKVPAGSFTGALLTAEWTRLEPDVLTEKSYVRGLGEVREVDVAGGDEKLELVKAVGT